MAQRDKILIIDANSIIHRAYHALPPLKTRDGKLVNAVYGFLLVFFKAIKKFNPRFVVAAFDYPAPTFRHQKYGQYKATRPPMPRELSVQIERVKDILMVFGVPIIEKKGFEADDLIGTIAKLSAPEVDGIIVSGDMDTLQLVDNHTSVWTMKRGIKDTAIYGEKEVREKYGVSPREFVEYKAILGDPSDNIPGVSGIGKKGASKLIKEFGSIQNIYASIHKIPKSTRDKLLKQKQQAFLSRELSRIKTDVPIEFRIKEAEFNKINKSLLIEKLREFEFYTMIKRIPELGQGVFIDEDDRETAGLGRDFAADLKELYTKDFFSKKIYDLEMKLIPIVAEMKDTGIAIDRELLSGLSKKISNIAADIAEQVYKIAGMRFNLNSPSQVADVLFQKLSISSDKIRKTPGGAVSTAASELEELAVEYPVAGMILKYRELMKLKAGFVDSLPKFIGSDGRIHPDFHQLGTETGRMSCSNPNLQNIPSKTPIGNEIRSCFIPGKDKRFLSADYSQAEIRIAAHLSGDGELISFFKQGGDIHKTTAAKIFNLPEDKITSEQRGLAKTLNFGVLYGMGPHALSKRAKISYGEAKEFIERYFEEFEGLADWRVEIIESARENGFVETLWGRRRFLPEINSIDKRVRASAERMAVNMPVQGTVADIIKMAMVELKKRDILNENCRLLVQVHDELLFEVDSIEIPETAAAVKKVMEGVINLKVPLVVDIREGDSWGKLALYDKILTVR